MSKADTIYALICSETIINEKKYIIESNNETHSKINDIRLQLLGVSGYMKRKERASITKRLYDIRKTTKSIERLKITY